MNTLPLIGYACGIGAGNIKCEKGPLYLQSSSHLNNLNVKWEKVLIPAQNKTKLAALAAIADISKQLADIAYHLTLQQQFFVTIGGDHSSAIGTWSGVASAIFPKKLGLLWIDAHLDSHTMDTTPSGNIHGMPLAALLGYGDRSLTTIRTEEPKLLPQNVCVLGVRSYEPEEQDLLEQLNVKIFYMDEIIKRGLPTVFEEAIDTVTSQSDYYGISLDLDAINPSEAPGVGSPEPSGIEFLSLAKAFDKIKSDHRLIAAEIAEFNPDLDKEEKTEAIIAHVLKQFASNNEKR